MITVSNVFSSVPPLFASLAKIITGDLDCSHASINAHSNDGSPYAVYPQAVLYPKTTADIKHAIAFAREYKIPLTVCGGRTAGSGGALSEGVVLDMTRYFSHIRNVNMLENTVTVDAGVPIDELITTLAGWGVEIPVLHREQGAGTIGGAVATKSATPSSFYAGTIREWIEGITVVVDSGEEHHIKDGVTPSGRLLGIYQAVFPILSEGSPILRASRREQSDDATGYALWNTQIGPRQLIDQVTSSEGTLAIITSITFRVAPRKQHALNLLIPISEYSLLESVIAIARHHRAESLFMFDLSFQKLVQKLHPQLLPGTLSESPLTLMMTLRGNDKETLHFHATTFLQALPQPVPLVQLEDHTAHKLASSSFLHSLFKDYSKGTYMISTAGEGLIVRPSSYGECISLLDEALAKTGRLYTITGYVGSGHVSATTGFDTTSPSYERDLEDYRDTLFLLAKTWKAGLSATGGDGLERTYGLPLIYNEATRDIFKRLKEAWDPLQIFNPGKKIHISKEYLAKHAIRGYINA